MKISVLFTLFSSFVLYQAAPARVKDPNVPVDFKVTSSQKGYFEAELTVTNNRPDSLVDYAVIFELSSDAKVKWVAADEASIEQYSSFFILKPNHEDSFEIGPDGDSYTFNFGIIHPGMEHNPASVFLTPLHLVETFKQQISARIPSFRPVSHPSHPAVFKPAVSTKESMLKAKGVAMIKRSQDGYFEVDLTVTNDEPHHISDYKVDFEIDGDATISWGVNDANFAKSGGKFTLSPTGKDALIIASNGDSYTFSFGMNHPGLHHELKNIVVRANDKRSTPGSSVNLVPPSHPRPHVENPPQKESQTHSRRKPREVRPVENQVQSGDNAGPHRKRPQALKHTKKVISIPAKFEVKISNNCTFDAEIQVTNPTDKVVENYVIEFELPGAQWNWSVDDEAEVGKTGDTFTITPIGASKTLSANGDSYTFEFGMTHPGLDHKIKNLRVVEA